MPTTTDPTARHSQLLGILEADHVGVLEDMTRERLAQLGQRVEQLAALASPADRQNLADVAEELAWLLDAFGVANHHHHGPTDDQCALCAGKQEIENKRAEDEARMWAESAAADEYADAAERGLGL